jgi:hypothetical protein
MADETPTTAPKKKVSQRIQDQFVGKRAEGLQSQLDRLRTQSGALSSSASEAQKAFEDFGAERHVKFHNSGDDGFRHNQKRSMARAEFLKTKAALDAHSGRVSTLEGQLADPTKLLEGKERDLVRGAQFGESVLGEEGLGRLGTDPEIAAAMSRTKRESEQGLSADEFAAQRSQAFEGIDRSTQTASRGALARLARLGVKGATGGQQIAQIEQAGQQSKAGVERDLFLKSADVQRQAFSDFKQSLGDVKSFDLGQQAKETDIILQSGLGFAQLGSAEKIAKLQADAQASAAAARSRGNSCWGAGALVMMMDGSVKAIEQIKLGDMTRHGKVEGRTQHIVPNAVMVKIDGINVVDSHPVKELDRWIESKNSVLAVTSISEATEVIVYDLITTMNRVEIRGESGFPYLFTDYNGHDMKEENDRLLEELNNVEGISKREIR